MTPQQTRHKRLILVCIRREETKREVRPPKRERYRKHHARKRIRWDMQA